MVQGLELTLVGMGVVLAGLAFLALVVRALEPLAAGRRPRPREETAADPPAQPVEEDSPPPGVVAAIAGAVAVTLGADPGEVRLVSAQAVKHAGTGPAGWALAGRMEQMRSRRRRGRGGGRTI